MWIAVWFAMMFTAPAPGLHPGTPTQTRGDLPEPRWGHWRYRWVTNRATRG